MNQKDACLRRMYAGDSYPAFFALYGLFGTCSGAMGSMLFYGIFSIINPCTREIVRDCVDENDQTTAIGIADAAQNNISTMISMLYSGFISERFGVNTLLSVCMVMAVATAALCMMLAARSASLSHRGRKKRSRQAA